MSVEYEIDPNAQGVEYQVTKVDPTDPETKGAVYQVHKVDEVTAAMSGKFYRARIIKDSSDPTVRGKVYQIVIIDDPDDPSVKGKVYNAIVTGDQEVVVIGPAVPPLSLTDAVANTLTSLKAFGGTKLSAIPVEYTQVDYAIKKGTAGVQGKFDTGLRPTVDDVKIEMQIKIGDEAQASGQTTVGSFYACQARATASSDITGISGSSATGSINGMQSGQSVASGIVRIKDHIDLIRYEYKNGNHSIYVKDLTTNTEDTQTGTYTFAEPTKNLYIFGNTTTTNNLNNNNAIYYCKIWVSGSLVFNAVPVIRNSDNLVGLYDKVSERFIEPIITEGGGFVAGDVTVPTPSDPMDIYCNNGKISVLDHTNWNVITNPNSETGKGMFINTEGKLSKANDRGSGVFIPVTVGKKYTVLINKQTTSLGSIIRYGQSNNGDLPSSSEQLLDWYRGAIENMMIISFTAKRPYFVMQLAASLVEAGGIDEAVEVLEAQGTGYTMLEYLVADGNSWVETNLSGAARWVGAGQATSESTGSKCILGALTGSGNAGVYLASRFGSSTDARNKRWTIDGASRATSVSGLTYAKYDIDYQENTFTGTINAESTSRTNTDTFTTWFIGSSRGISGGVTTNYPFVGNIYRQQAYQNNVLVGDFIPAIRNSDSVVGMYDTVSGTFFTNAGTGVFVAGTPLGDGEVLKLTPSNDTAGVANLFKIASDADTQEILTGAINHKIGIRVLDGTEDWVGTTAAGVSWYMADILDKNMFSHLVCTHFVNNVVLSADNTIYKSAGASMLQIRYDTASDLTAFKSWLATQYSAGTPVIVVYGLETPYEEPAPIPQTMQVVAGDNVLEIVQAGMSGLEVEAKYTKEG